MSDSREQMREEFEKWRTHWGFLLNRGVECTAPENLQPAYEAIVRAATARAYEKAVNEAHGAQWDGWPEWNEAVCLVADRIAALAATEESHE